MKKLIFNLFLILCLLLVFSSTSFAAGNTVLEYFRNPKLDSTIKFETASSQIYTILKTFGLILAVCIMLTIAISYMISTPNKRAILKERLIYYFTGVIFLIAGVGFLGWYEGVANDVKKIVEGTSSGSSGYTNSNGEWVYFNDVAQDIKLLLDVPLHEIKAMNYNDVKYYTNTLDDAISQYKKEQKNGTIVNSSGSAQQLSNAEQRLKDAKEILTEKYDE